MQNFNLIMAPEAKKDLNKQCEKMRSKENVSIKLGFTQTCRAIFSAPATMEHRRLTAERMRELKSNAY